MRFVVLFFILISQSACTLYQSDGREAIEKNSAGIVVLQGFDSVQGIGFECIRSLAEPEQVKGPTEVIESDFEEKGYSSYLIHETLLVYKAPEVESMSAHYFCNMDTLGDLSLQKLVSAIRLGVQLLDEQKRLD